MMFKKGRPKMLFRRENTTARGAIRHGGEYRWQRHKKHAIDENLPMREGMHGRMQQGIDYTPLFKFLLRNVGQPWVDVHREAISRLDKEEPIFYLVALQRKNLSSYVRYGESSYYSGLRCCTYTFNGERVPVTEKNWLKPYEKENWE